MTVFRIWLYRRAHALVCVDAATPQEARDIAHAVIPEAEWEWAPFTSDVQAARKDWPAPDRCWTGDLETGRWIYPETSMFEEPA